MLGVGQVIRTGSPDSEFVARIEELLRSETLFTELAVITYDPRMTCERWYTALRVELLMLFKWALRRCMNIAGQVAMTGPIGAEERVLVLLPTYGFALHALRRAVPFAALGMKVVISVSPENLDEAKKALLALLQFLHVDSLIDVSNEHPTRLVAHFATSMSPIFMTGRYSTFEAIRSRYPNARIYGATGTCSVIIGLDRDAAIALEQMLHAMHLPISCSNHGLTLICEGYSDNSPVLSMQGLVTHDVPSTLADEIRRVHPSVIFAVTNQAAIPIATHIADYSVVKCGADGEPESREGFARDPLCGWPGDYCV